MVTVQERAHYQPGFGVSWARLPTLIALAMSAAVGLAWCLKFAFVSGWYLIFLLPIVGALALGGLLHLFVGWAHCRNRRLAAAVGIVAGLVGYLGYYELCFLDALPPGAEWRVDLLPDYIMFRMNTDVSVDAAQPDDAQARAKPFAPLNWLAFLCELGIVVGMCGAMAWSRARRAYCRELGRWMHREKAPLPPLSGLPLLDALETDRLAEFVASTQPGGDAQTACQFTLEYATPADGSPLDYPVYASVEGHDPHRPSRMSGNMRRTLLRQVELKPAEVLTVQPWFSDLAQRLAAHHPELRDVPSDVRAAPTSEAPASELAEVTPVPERFRKRVRGRGYAIWVNILDIIPGVYFLGGGGLAAGGIWLAVERAMPLGWAGAAVGAAAFVWGAYTGLYCMSVSGHRWINRRLRREIGLRPDALVDPKSRESLFVSLVPREAFAKIQLTMSSDLLLLKTDQPQRRVLMEGDSDRYQIPAAAIAVCEPECFFHAIDAQHTNELWMTRLVIQVEQGTRELLLSADPTSWAPVNNNGRRRIAEGLCQRINALRGQTPGEPSAAT